MQQILLGREYPDYVIEKVRNAKKYVKILVFCWYWYPDDIGSKIQKFNYELIRARQRGVEISCVANFFNGQNAFTDQKIKLKIHESKKTLHAKFMIIDGECLVLGSHNLSKNAFELNHEVSVAIDEVVSIARCEAFFDSLFAL